MKKHIAALSSILLLLASASALEKCVSAVECIDAGGDISFSGDDGNDSDEYCKNGAYDGRCIDEEENSDDTTEESRNCCIGMVRVCGSYLRQKNSDKACVDAAGDPLIDNAMYRCDHTGGVPSFDNDCQNCIMEKGFLMPGTLHARCNY
ncbi:hypothetical protein EC973_000273 [Apophysomyces ossiformis]|uniref:Secreted protein n=1 Tax=Apophysomyces ossiformis TaxID=679940 RepID=A0A8H7BUW4_9FUNG|nr:hypothetical protein EC973_000273 [Apophysomyces ossiformis]